MVMGTAAFPSLIFSFARQICTWLALNLHITAIGRYELESVCIKMALPDEELKHYHTHDLGQPNGTEKIDHSYVCMSTAFS